MKFCSYRIPRSILNLVKVGYQNDGVSIRMPRATRFYSINHNPQNINSNKVDAPFVRPESRVTRNLLDDDDDQHNNGLYHENNEGIRRTEEATDYVANKAKRGTRRAVETAFNVGEKLAEGMQQTFGVIKETTQKVKDTIVGKDDDNGEDGYGKHTRKKGGGYGHRSH